MMMENQERLLGFIVDHLVYYSSLLAIIRKFYFLDPFGLFSVEYFLLGFYFVSYLVVLGFGFLFKNSYCNLF
jgi:hypothetical protein